MSVAKLRLLFSRHVYAALVDKARDLRCMNDQIFNSIGLDHMKTMIYCVRFSQGPSMSQIDEDGICRLLPNSVKYRATDLIILVLTSNPLDAISGYLRLEKFVYYVDTSQSVGSRWITIQNFKLSPAEENWRKAPAEIFLREPILQHAIPRNLRTYPSSRILPQVKNSQRLTMYSKFTRNRARYWERNTQWYATVTLSAIFAVAYSCNSVVVVASSGPVYRHRKLAVQYDFQSRDERRPPSLLHELVIKARNKSQDVGKCEAVKSRVYILTTTAKTHCHQENKKPVAGMHAGFSQRHFQPTVFGRAPSPETGHRHGWNQEVLATRYDLIESVSLPGIGNLAHRVAKSSIAFFGPALLSLIPPAPSRNDHLSNDASNPPAIPKMKLPDRLPSCPRFQLLCILPVNASQHVCGVGYVDCSPANVVHEPRLAMIPTLELHYTFHRAFINLYHEQKFGATRPKETTMARFFKRVGEDVRLKGKMETVISFFHEPFDLNVFESVCFVVVSLMPPFPYRVRIYYLDACNFDTEVQVRSMTAEQLSKYP
ncbi:hypothetical protein ARMSODRAFT_976253 [Armillaria solidipes]|uniref:Uncharacterized protein n=1 Tax=Armillaria solidipes TaxID=1076256 RepID=A0A2H3BAT6_9AGAR|nr:hypothetical protein ARMSODRAFT_976253 [Armillaria solidipes]